MTTVGKKDVIESCPPTGPVLSVLHSTPFNPHSSLGSRGAPQGWQAPCSPVSAPHRSTQGE